MTAPEDVKDGADDEQPLTPGVVGYSHINRDIPYLSLNSPAGFQQSRNAGNPDERAFAAKGVVAGLRSVNFLLTLRGVKDS